MQLRFEQLNTHLQQPLCALYWIASDDPYLQQQACAEIQTAAKQQGFTEQISTQPQTVSDWQSLSQHYQNLSLFSEKTFITLHAPSGKFDAQARKALQAYLDTAPENTVLLVRTPKMISQTQKAAWFKKLLEQMVFVPIWPLTREQFPRWLQTKIRAIDLDIDADALAFLAEQTEGNLLAAAQNVEKLSLLFENKHRLTSQDISFAIGASSHYDVFTVVADACDANIPHLIQGLHHLQQTNTALPLVLWALSREVRVALQIQTQIASGQPHAQALQSQRLYGKQQQRVSQLLSRHSLPGLQRMIQHCQRIDGMIKGQHTGNPWAALQQVCLSLAGRPLFQGAKT